jgi:hypothetical protein
MIFFYNYWSPFSNAYLNIYPVAAVVCILFYCFLKSKWKHEMINWLYVFNTIVPLLTLINLLFFLAELFLAWYGQNPYEWYAFKEGRGNISSPYGWSYWLLLVSNILLPQLLWFKKLRKSIIMTFLIIFFSSFVIWFERLIIYFTSIYRDYLPSSWATYYEHESLLLTFFVKPVCFVIISVIVYFVFYKRNKLPYTSVFLK